jgi:predicted acyltransferase
MSENRLDAIDAFRGLAILGMVIANFIAGVNWIPAWLKHAPDAGFTVIDLVAPMFIFAIGLTYGPSARKRLERDGAWKMTQHFVVRFAAILGIGALFGAGEVLLQVDGQVINWGVLQAIGVAGLVTLIVIRLPAWARLLIGLALLTGYQFLLERFWLAKVLASPHGGLYGALAWSAMLILATVLGDLFHQQRRAHWNLALASALAVLVAFGLTLCFPVSKNRVSAPYVLLSLGLSGLLFSAFHIFVEHFKWKANLLVMWGRNPLVLYVLHLLLLGFVALPEVPGWYRSAPLWLVIVQGIVLLGVLTLIAWGLDRKQKYLSV